MTRPLFFLLISAVIVSSSESRSIFPRPQPLSSLKINRTQNAGTCSFTVSIRTSCSSTRYTRDHVSLSFGDAYGNQVYAPRLDDPSSRTFERCSTDTFQINGPCTYQICYLYLYRSGYDGWMPYDVSVYGYNTQPVTFYYNVIIPRDICVIFYVANFARHEKRCSGDIQDGPSCMISKLWCSQQADSSSLQEVPARLTCYKGFYDGLKRIMVAINLVRKVGGAVRFGTKGRAITFVSSASDSDVLNQPAPYQCMQLIFKDYLYTLSIGKKYT